MTCSQTGGIEGGSGGVIKVGMLVWGLAGGVEASGGGGGGGAKRRVRGHKATVGCGHDGGWELVVGARARKEVPNFFCFLVGLGLER